MRSEPLRLSDGTKASITWNPKTSGVQTLPEHPPTSPVLPVAKENAVTLVRAPVDTPAPVRPWEVQVIEVCTCGASLLQEMTTATGPGRCPAEAGVTKATSVPATTAIVAPKMTMRNLDFPRYPIPPT